jgi:hypothetical protein
VPTRGGLAISGTHEATIGTARELAQFLGRINDARDFDVLHAIQVEIVTQHDADEAAPRLLTSGERRTPPRRPRALTRCESRAARARSV